MMTLSRDAVNRREPPKTSCVTLKVATLSEPNYTLRFNFQLFLPIWCHHYNYIHSHSVIIHGIVL